MTTSLGSSLQNQFSKPISGRTFSVQSGLGLCVLIGVVAALVDVYLRLPLHLPGWRGFITMGLFIAARRLTGRGWAASASAFAAALTALALAGPPRFSTLAFLVPGLVIDGLYFVDRRWQGSILLAGIAAALGNVAKFAIAFLGVSIFAQSDGSVSFMLLPWVSHFGFGLCGGLVAALLTQSGQRKAAQ